MNNTEFCMYISSLATKSMIYEVSASPKPGLVDRLNSGAHKDMDFFTFIDSSMILTDYFYKCTMAGIEFKEGDYSLLLKNIRPFGIEAEKNMFEATNGVNTHKGLVFSLGIISAAAGLLYSRNNSVYIATEKITDLVKLMAKDITLELENCRDKETPTYGEKLYLQYGVKGIRGEVEEGFNTVLKYSLPILKDLINTGNHINDILVQVLLNLMAHTEDSNILGRHSMETLNFVKEKAGFALDHGGYLTPYGKLYVKEMDKYFINRNISPGGSADLLAITIMLYMLENGSKLV